MTDLERIRTIIEKNSAPTRYGDRVIDDIDIDTIAEEISNYMDLIRKNLV